MGNIPLEQGRKGDTEQKVKPSGFDIPPQVFEKSQEKVWVGIPAFRFIKASEIEERLFSIEYPHQHPSDNTAKKTGNDAYRKGGCPQGSAVNHQLGVEKDGAHHKGGQPVVLDAAAGKGSCDGDSAIHTQRRGDSQSACQYDAKDPQPPPPKRAEAVVDRILDKDRNGGAQHHPQHPVPEDLPKLEVKVVPQIHRLSADGFSHQYSPAGSCGSPGRSFPPAPRCECRCGTPYAE